MNNNEMRDVAVASAPLMTTPLAPLVVMGGIGILIYWAFKSDKKEEFEQLETVKSTVGNGTEPYKLTVQPTVQTVKQTVHETVQKSPMYTYIENSTVEDDEIGELEEEEIEESEPKLTDEQVKKEILRQAMSELGKRSAEARRKKRIK
ncbi:MAG: hypothetical protein GY793_04175 [Proteobacteria bacterium]|nr:hypothetical protein [Pseudomonadota bacterium]